MNKDIEDMKKQFDMLTNALENLKEKARVVMPLVADSLQLTIKILEVYREAYVTGLGKDEKDKAK